MKKPFDSSAIVRGALALAFALALSSAHADQLFDVNTVLDAELRGPIGTLIESRHERTELPFSLVIDGVATPVKVRTRGHSRLRVCDFPPLRLNFSSDTAAGSLFEDQDKLKLVTHCNNKRNDAGNVLNEFLAYRLFGLISERGYRVRRLRLRYVGSEAPQESQDAFLIESAAALAARLGADSLSAPGVFLSRLDQRQAAIVYVFQYLIGNTDWSLVKAEAAAECCHNIDLFEKDQRTLIVPYDFDLAGLVDASYARPDRSLRIASVRSRQYRGYCLPGEVLGQALDHIVSLEAVLLETASVTPAYDERDMQQRIDFLTRFFVKAGQRDRLLRDFEKRCLD